MVDYFRYLQMKVEVEVKGQNHEFVRVVLKQLLQAPYFQRLSYVTIISHNL